MFISLVVAVVIARLFAPGSLSLAREAIKGRYLAALGPAGGQTVADGRFYLILASPVVLYLGVTALLCSIGLYWLAEALGFCVLLLALGGAELSDQVGLYVEDLKRNDIQAAFHSAAGLNREGLESGARSWKQLHEETLASVAQRYFEYYFPAIFWFAVLGAPAVVFYKSVSALRGKVSAPVEQESLARIRYLLEWLPARGFALGVAVVGNFAPVMNELRGLLLDFSLPTRELVVRCVRSALKDLAAPSVDTPSQEVQELAEMPALIDRALVTWLAILGVLAIFQ